MSFYTMVLKWAQNKDKNVLKHTFSSGEIDLESLSAFVPDRNCNINKANINNAKLIQFLHNVNPKWVSLLLLTFKAPISGVSIKLEVRSQKES